mgnify:CR=1 FL=1
MYIVVVGGGKVGYYLVKTLLEQRHQVALVELRYGRCRAIAEDLGILTINGDGTSLSCLADAGADKADVVAAVTGKDEVNLLACQLARRKFDVRQVIARLNNPKNRDIFRKLGVELTVSSTALIADLIGRELARQSMRTLLTFHHAEITLVEVDLHDKSRAVYRTVQELAPTLPPGCVLVSVIRGEQVIIPKGGTALLPGDSVMALAHSGTVVTLRQALIGEEE